MAKFRVMRVAPAAFEPPCGCSQEVPEVIWEGDDPSEYLGGLGAFDEGCHHPSRWMEIRLPSGEWVYVSRTEALSAA